MAVPKRRNSVTENGNSVDGKRKTKRRKFRTKRRKLLKISVKVPKKRNFFFKVRKFKKKENFFLNLYKMLSLMKINKKNYVPEDPVFGTRYYLCFFIFFSMVVPGTKCSQKKFGKFFGLKKGDLVPG